MATSMGCEIAAPNSQYLGVTDEEESHLQQNRIEHWFATGFV
jgi:hypothetical protein